MTWKEFALSTAGIVVMTGALIFYLASGATPVRYFIAYQGEDEFRVEADEAKIEGFCTVFIKDEVRIAAICGQHTWSEAR